MYYVDGKALKMALLDKGYRSVLDFCKKTRCVSNQTLSNIICGRTKPSGNVIIDIADALDFTSEDIGRIFFASKLSE